MPSLETPPNPVQEPPAPIKVPAGRFGELDHHELVRLLDSLDDDRSRSRFRESIYISLIFYLALAWFVFYGPRVLWHTPQVVQVQDKEDKKHELTYLETPKNLSKLLPKTPPKAISDKTAVAQTAHPSPEKVLETPRRAGPPIPTPKPTPAPAPKAAAPAPTQAQTQAPPTPQPPPPPKPQPAPKPIQNIPDAPKPSPFGRPNFNNSQTAGDTIAQAARDAAAARGSGGAGVDDGVGATPKHPGMNTGAEILSDTMGVDFEPYIKRILAMIKASWYPLIPEETRPPLSKEGTTLIRFRIEKDGTLSYMHLDDSTHDDAINRAAWGGIKGVGQYPPLPPAFRGQQLDLRIQFIIKQYRRGAE